MLFLRQSTSIDIRMGPFLDSVDGVTPETGITIAAADQAEVLKANGAATVAMTGTLAAVSGCDGWYDYTVQTGDVDTVGEVVFVLQDSSVCLPVFVRGYVVEEAIYDLIFGASATLATNVSDIETDTQNIQSRLPTALVSGRMSSDAVAISGNTAAADGLEAALEANVQGSCTGTPSTTSIPTDLTEATTDHYATRNIYFTSGVCDGQMSNITAYNGATKTLTVDALTDAPSSGDTFIIA